MKDFGAHINQLIRPAKGPFEIDAGDGLFLTAKIVKWAESAETEILRPYSFRVVLVTKAERFTFDEHDNDSEETLDIGDAVVELFRPVSAEYSNGNFAELVSDNTGKRYPVCWQNEDGSFGFLEIQR